MRRLGNVPSLRDWPRRLMIFRVSNADRHIPSQAGNRYYLKTQIHT
jgi:hypothetical protein